MKIRDACEGAGAGRLRGKGGGQGEEGRQEVECVWAGGCGVGGWRAVERVDHVSVECGCEDERQVEEGGGGVEGEK